MAIKKISLTKEIAEITGFSIKSQTALAHIIKRAKYDLNMWASEYDSDPMPTHALNEEGKRKILEWCKTKKISKETPEIKKEKGYITQAVFVEGKRKFVSLNRKYREILEQCNITNYCDYLSDRIEKQNPTDKRKKLITQVQDIILETMTNKMAEVGFKGLYLSRIDIENE